MKEVSVTDKITFTECFRTILYRLFADGEHMVYAYYQKHCSFIFKVEADMVGFNFYYHLIKLAVEVFETLGSSYPDLMFYEIVSKHSGDEILPLTWRQLFAKRKEFYENDGRRFISAHEPMSILYAGKNILDRITPSMIKPTLFSPSFMRNDFADILHTIYLDMLHKNYAFLPTTTVKTFVRDIIEPLYPNLSSHEQNFIWKLFKPKETVTIN